MRIHEQYSEGDKVDFSIKVSGLNRELKATGDVVFNGKNSEGVVGTGLKFIFDKETKDFLNKTIPLIIDDKYGAVWGPKICSFMEEGK